MVAAHPDDVDFGAAGTVATWVAEGIEVTYCIVTDGDAGGFDPGLTRPELAAIRRAEQRAAAGVVGVSDVVFLGYPDGRLQVSLDLRRDIARVIRDVRPQRVLTQSPERNWDRVHASHPDHLAAGEATICAVYPDARNPFAHPELLEEGYGAHTVSEVWLMGAAPGGGGGGTVVVDITARLDTKLAALRCHASQLAPSFELEPMIRGWTAGTASRAGLAEGSFAEEFRVIDTR